ncbi:uncharacterized protein LOC117321911 [Pecten maximus]|uniref:uncharacterized protein LOC117321911 n=1 Tax=Pecten maximus TaxID=6579 RepID=UPI0014585C36|nr:uncharacterized protein LOC117321911 [Pecten maximus]
MTVINTNPVSKGRFTRVAHALLVCTTLAKGVGVTYVVIVSLMIGREGVLDQGQRMVLNQFYLYGLPLGDLSEGVAYTLYVMLPLNTIFGIIGLLGVLCRNKLLILMYTGSLVLALVLDIILLTLTSILLNGLSSWVQGSFENAFSYYSSAWINTDLQTAWNAMFINLDCCGVSGTYNYCAGIGTKPGCWNKYYTPMTGSVLSLFILLIYSIVLDIVGLVIAELAYQRLDSKLKNNCSSSMYREFGKFVQRSWQMGKAKVIFTVITVLDMMAGLGMVVAGAVTLQSDFVSNSFLSPLFGNLRFYNIYLPELMLGLGVTMIIVGVFNTGVCGLGLNILCFKSKSKIIIARVLQTVMTVVFLTMLVFWSVMLEEVRGKMEFQLYKEFLGYDSQFDYGDYFTQSWKALFVTFTCCKVKGLDYMVSPISSGIPEQCLYERTPINSNLHYVGATITTGTINQEFCEEKLSDEIYKYQVTVAVLFGIAICSKIYAIGYLFSKDNRTDDDTPRVPLSVTLRGVKRKKMQVMLTVVLVTGLSISLGILLTGTILRFDNVFGHKDIKHLFSYVYLSGNNLDFWMLALTYFMITMGSVTLLLFGSAFVSVASDFPAFYIAPLSGIVLSVSTKLIAICVWINVRVEIDWTLVPEMRSALLNYYRTDSSDNYLYHGDVNLGFNFLFYEGDCCGVDSISDFYSVSWVSNYFYPSYPRTCHLDADTVRWYTNRAMSSFKDTVYTKGCAKEVLDSIHNYDIAGFVLLSLSLVLEVTTFVLLDRRYKQRVSPDQLRGAFSTFVRHVTGNSVNNSSYMPGLTAKTIVFASLTAFLMLAEILLWVGVLIQTFAPGYLTYGLVKKLTEAEHWFNDQHPHLGYLLYGLLITIFVTEMLFVIMHVITIFAMRTHRKGFIYMSVVLLAFMIICDIITLSLASVLNDKAGHNCEDTFYWFGFCDTQASSVFLMTGLFIGFDVVHTVCLCVLIALALHLSKIASPVTLVTPVDGLSGLDTVSISQPVQRSSIRENHADNTIANFSSDHSGHTTGRKSSKAQSNTERETPISQPRTGRRTSIAQSNKGRRTSIAPPTTGRKTSLARPTKDRRSSVTSNARSVEDQTTLPHENDNIDDDDLETTYA